MKREKCPTEVLLLPRFCPSQFLIDGITDPLTYINWATIAHPPPVPSKGPEQLGSERESMQIVMDCSSHSFLTPSLPLAPLPSRSMQWGLVYYVFLFMLLRVLISPFYHSWLLRILCPPGCNYEVDVVMCSPNPLSGQKNLIPQLLGVQPEEGPHLFTIFETCFCWRKMSGPNPHLLPAATGIRWPINMGI